MPEHPTTEKTTTIVEAIAADLKPEMIRVDASELKADLRSIVRGTVEETLNGLLESEAQEICNAKRYQRTEERNAHRSGSRHRGPHLAARARVRKKEMPIAAAATSAN